jgi:thiol-disulfide isomerase/thioredoxin
MRTLFALVAVTAGLTAAAQEPAKPDQPAKRAGPKRAEPTLKVGDKPPPLKADKWLQGTEVKGFEAGKVYVVEFWATWCGPCIVMMPHMADLQDELKGQVVTLVGFTAKDPNNDKEKVERFVEKRGPKLGYTFAYADDRETYDAYMKAAGQNGIPCCFVVGKDGTIAFIGHPMYLDLVLPKVVAGTWDAAKEKEQLDAANADVDGVFEKLRGSPEAVLKTLAEFDAKWPALAGVPYFTAPRLRALVQAKKVDEAKALAEGLVAKAGKRGDSSVLGTVAGSLAGAKGQPELTAMGLKAADAYLAEAGGDDVAALMTARSAYAAAGQGDKAKELGGRAVAAAEKAVMGNDDLGGYLRLISVCRAAGQADKAKEFAAKAVPAAEKAVKGDKDWQGNLQLAGLCKQAGEDDKAKAAAQKAYENAPENMRPRLVAAVKQYGVEVKKDDK